MPASAVPMPTVSAVYETHLTVRDLKASIAFYREVLGLELAHRVPARDAAFFWVGQKERGMLGLWQTGSGPMGMRLHIAFASTKSEILAAPQALLARGIEPLGMNGEPVSEPVVIGWMPALSLYFSDPDGHSLEYISMLPGEPDRDFGVAPWSQWQKKHGKNPVS